MKFYTFIILLFMVGYVPVYLTAGDQLRKYVGPRFAALFAIITLEGVLSPNPAIYFGLLFITVLASIRDRFDAACIYTLLAGLTPAATWGAQIGGLFLTFVGSLDVVALAAYIAARSRSSGGQRTRGFTVEDGVILVLFLILSVGATRFPSATQIMRSYFSQVLLIVLPYLTLRRAAVSKEEFRLLLACQAAVVVIVSVFAIYERHAGWAVFDVISQRLGASGMSLSTMRRGDALRASVTMAGPLMLGCYLSLGIIAIACSRRFIRGKIGFYGWLGVSGLGLLAAQSRGNVLVLTAALIVLLMVRRKWGLAIGAIGAAVTGAATLFVLAPTSSRVSAFLSGDTANAAGPIQDYRQVLLQRGWQEAMKHPIVGVSLDAALNGLQDIKQGQHIVDLVNVYLTLFLVSGAVGALTFIALLVLTFGKMMRRAMGGQEDTYLQAFCLAAFTGYLIELSFMSFIDRMPFVLAFILTGSRILASRKSVGAVGGGDIRLQPRASRVPTRSRPERAPKPA